MCYPTCDHCPMILTDSVLTYLYIHVDCRVVSPLFWSRCFGCSSVFCFFFQQRSHQVFSICSLLYWHQHWTLTQLFLRGPFFHKGDSLQDSPEHHTQGEDVSLGCVGQSTPHLRSHVEVRATGGGEVLPRQVSIQQTFTHLAQTKVCHLENGQEQSLK